MTTDSRNLTGDHDHRISSFGDPKPPKLKIPNLYQTLHHQVPVFEIGFLSTLLIAFWKTL
jgi:hypothetical protein